MQTVTVTEAQAWLVEKLAVRLEVEASEIDVERYFDEFDLDSTEALILAGELEKWLGFELEATALWYHPTVAALSEHIAEESANHVAAA
ncbi:acyl carrier protein [Streptomyces sp. NPDC091271]|uniref:acyl carrier protein n=1 Tax=Streptomyces sp. NPDC091271 TaxID=3365980 RepID=UPI00381C7975